MLLTVLHHLRDRGNDVVVVEHNLDVIEIANWESGGGRITAEGPPEEIVKVAASYNGRHLRPVLDAHGRRRRDSARPAHVLRARKASGDLPAG